MLMVMVMVLIQTMVVAVVNLLLSFFVTAVCSNFRGAHYKSRKAACFMPREKVSETPIGHS